VNQSNFDLTRSNAEDSLFDERSPTIFDRLKGAELWQRTLTLFAAWQLTIGLLIKRQNIRAEATISAVTNAKGSSIKILSSISARQLLDKIGLPFYLDSALKLDGIANLRGLLQRTKAGAF
jgi:hypothetical protein